MRGWVKPHSDHRRSTDRAIVDAASPTLVRLLGFHRQSSVDALDGRSLVVQAPGATDFYGNGKHPNPDWGRFLVRSQWSDVEA